MYKQGRIDISNFVQLSGMKKLLIIFILTFSCMAGSAQYMDTLRKAFTGDRNFDFRYENKWSFVNHDAITVNSIKMGVNFGKKISLGLGYNWLKPKIKDEFVLHDNGLNKDTLLHKTLKLGYVCIYGDYIFHKSKRWQYSIPTQFGIGTTHFEYTYNGISTSEKNHFIALYEPCVDVKYKIFKWLGLDANIGYRLVLKNNHFLSQSLNSPVYSMGAEVYWSELALALFPKSKHIDKWFGPSEW